MTKCLTDKECAVCGCYVKSRLLTNKECAWMERIDKEVDGVWSDLTLWEQKFIEDLLQRFKRFGD